MTWVWFLTAMAPAFLHALSNTVDQYVVRTHTAGSPWLFLTLSGCVCLVLGFGLYPFLPLGHAPTPEQTLWIMMAAVVFSLASIPYLYALEDEDAHAFTPVFLVAPVMVALLGYIFLGETLTLAQAVGGVVVIGGAAASMTDWHRLHFKARPFWLIVLCMAIYAVYVILLRSVAPDVHWLHATFWLCMGWAALSGLVIVVSGATRRLLIAKIRATRGAIFSSTVFQETADVAANSARTVALGFAAVPVAVTDLLGGFEIVFALVFGAMAARIMPSVFTFTLTRRELLYKIACFVVMMMGLGLVVR